MWPQKKFGSILNSLNSNSQTADTMLLNMISTTYFYPYLVKIFMIKIIVENKQNFITIKIEVLHLIVVVRKFRETNFREILGSTTLVTTWVWFCPFWPPSYLYVNVDTNGHFWFTYPPHFVHVVIERLLILNIWKFQCFSKKKKIFYISYSNLKKKI